MSNIDAIPSPATAVGAEPLDVLRLRTSEKWTSYPDDVLPLFVAEMDYPLAEPIVSTLLARVQASDTGYVGSPGPLAPAFAAFAGRRWGWTPSPSDIRTTTDVSVAIVETLRQVLRPGDGVVITPPIYPPFFDLVPEAGGVVVEVPLLVGAAGSRGAGYSLDLAGLERVFAGVDGHPPVRAFLLCNPHNPVGMVPTGAELAAIAELAARYGVIVVSDEIHGPLVHHGETFTPFLSLSDAARSIGVTVTSASKGWNLAGLKCALMVASSPRTRSILEGMPEEVGFRTGLLGLHASVAGYTEGEEWLDSAITAIQDSRSLLAELLAEHMPLVEYRMPRASYLAWLDFRPLGWGDDPAADILAHARVALSSGHTFGTQGAGFVRLNLACSPEVLTEAVLRIAASAASISAAQGDSRG